MPYTTITFGGVTLNALNVDKSLVPGTIKQTLGGEVIQIVIPGRAKENRITIVGQMFGSTIDTDRTALLALDNGKAYDYSDGLLTGKKMMIDSLTFADDGEREATVYDYTLELVEFVQ